MGQEGAVVLELEKLWTCLDLAEYFGVPIDTVHRAAKRGSIPGCTRAIGRYVFDRDVAVAGWRPAESVIVESGVSSHIEAVPRESQGFYLIALTAAVDGEVWAQICERAAEQAIGGDRYARKWISDYLVGVPVHRIAAEVGIVTHREFSDEDRAAVVAALLKIAKGRDEQASKANSNGETTD